MDGVKNNHPSWKGLQTSSGITEWDSEVHFAPLSNDWREWPWLVPCLIYVTNWMMCNKAARAVPGCRGSLPPPLWQYLAAGCGWHRFRSGWKTEEEPQIEENCSHRRKDTIFRIITKKSHPHTVCSYAAFQVVYDLLTYLLMYIIAKKKQKKNKHHHIIFRLGNTVLYVICCAKI